MSCLKTSIIVLILTALMGVTPLLAQSAFSYFENAAAGTVYPARLKAEVGYLCDSLCGGRASGTPGGVLASRWVQRQFEKSKLAPLADSSYYLLCPSQDSTCLIHSVAGILYPKQRREAGYVVICAHSDALGSLGGRLFPGADSNASGTVAVTSLARMFTSRKTLGTSPSCPLIFVVFDGKEKGSAGARNFASLLKEEALTDAESGKPIREKDIRMLVNIDQVGATLSPVHADRKDYLIMLGNERLKGDAQAARDLVHHPECKLDLCFDYYGSKSFTEVFYHLADRSAFKDSPFPLLYFTSGITFSNNKPSDNAESLDYEVFCRLIRFVFHWLCRFV